MYFGITVSCCVSAVAAKRPVLLIENEHKPSCFSPVGRTLHDSNRLHQEQTDHFLLGVGGCRRERGSSVPPAVVSSGTGMLHHPVNLHLWSSLCFVHLKKTNLEFLLCRSMLPDVVDDFKVKNPGVHGHEALFYSFFVFFVKFASGVSLGISTLSLK